MNIGIFSDTYYPQLNGVATSIATLAKGLEKKGHHVYIFTPSDPRASEEPEPNVFRLPSMPFLFVKHYRAGILCPPNLLRKIHSLELDVIHTQTEFSLGFLGKIIAAAQGIPLIHTYHTMYEDYVHYIAKGYLISPDMAREFSKFFCNSTADVIAPTDKTKNLLQSYGVTTPISVIPTGIDTAHFRKEDYDPAQILALRHSLGLDKDTPVILSLGRIAKEKSIDVVIGALPRLLERLPQAKMVIVGEGPEIEALQSYGDSLGIGDRLLFTGGKPWAEIGKYYQLGNVFCSASVSETQGLTFAEAMAAGVPVVAKKDPCIENIISHNETGLLFEDASVLPDLLYQILTDAHLCQRLSVAGIAEMQKLSVDTFAADVEALYHTAVAAKNISGNVFPSPLVIGARAARGFTRIPRRLVQRSLHRSHQIFRSLPSITRKK